MISKKVFDSVSKSYFENEAVIHIPEIESEITPLIYKI